MINHFRKETLQTSAIDGDCIAYTRVVEGSQTVTGDPKFGEAPCRAGCRPRSAAAAR